jgi:AraC family transcriptional regulator
LHIVIPSAVEQRLSRDFAAGRALGEVLHEVAAPVSVALQREFLSPSSSSPVIVEALLLDLVSRHLRIVCERSALRPIWIRSLMEYLNDTFEEDWTLGGLAEDLGIHPVHLCRTFAQHQKCTLGAYIHQLRIIRGRQLLELSSDSIANIATNCGFSDQSHFTRAFKTRFGIAPGAFRRNAPAPKKYPAQR